MTVNTIKDQYYKKLGKIMLGLSLGHIPLFVLTAALFNTEYSIALGLASFFIIPQLIAYYKTPHSPLSLYLFSFIIMCFSGILIHLGKGMIEMHFHVFVFIPITAIFGLYWAPIIAAVTIAIHHIGFFFLLPESIFNYEASFSIVILHATFVIVETAIAIFVCKKFKDFLEKEEYVNSKLSLIGASYGKEGKSIKTMADRISEQSQRQIEFTQKTSSAATEISALSKTNLEHVSNSVQIVQDSNEKIKSGNKVIKSAIEANDNINNQFKSIMDAFSGINSSFQEVNSLMHEISEKTGIINDIVFQTKLLSFNASVEAARAGEHGKGFAVVAEEIGTLAQTSGNAANEINIIVGNSTEKFSVLRSEINQLTEKTEKETTQSIENNSNNTEQIRLVFEDINHTFSQLNNYFSQFKVSTEEQNIGIEDISNALINMEELVNEAKKMASENFESSKAINQNNEFLEDFINSFNNKSKAA